MDSCDTEYVKPCGNLETHQSHFYVSYDAIIGMDWDEFCPGVNSDADFVSS
jgi:hypothetical protein